MDTADRVSLVALLVSLIALGVAFLQLCQQYFATADGYRNCAQSVIGPWHRTRYRRFVPSEFRFETVYDAPLIRVLRISEFVDHNDSGQHEKRVHLLYPLHRETCCEGECLLYETVDPSRAFTKVLTHGWRSKLPNWTGLRVAPKGYKIKHDSEKGAIAPRRQYEEQPSALVSWISFMGALHHTYSSYGQASNGDDLEDKCLSQVTNNRTSPIVEQKRVHWDFRGSDVTRPVAQTRLGDIILFALRMGMQWRRIVIERGALLAVGNGYSLSSVNRSGLVVTFTSTGHNKTPTRIIPSQDADKMMFGILPGDPDLVNMEFNMVGSTGQRENPASILKRILEPHEFDEDDEVDRIDSIKLGAMAARNDIQKLLCPFLPQKYANTALVRFLGWPRHRAASFLHMYESRIALVQQLDAEVRRHPSQYPEEDLKSLWTVKTQLDGLKDNYPSDFYCVEFTPRQSLRPNDSQKNLYTLELFVQKCKDIFDNCTNTLRSHGWGCKVDSVAENSSTKYAFLVAAHIAVANNADEEARKDFRDTKRRMRGLDHGDWAEVIGLDQQALTEAQLKPRLGNPRFYFQMNKIVQHMKSGDHGIRKELAKLRVEVTDAQAQFAWWMMMIRGIAWDMSCYREAWPADDPFVPSTYYGDPTPVMLA